MYAYRPPLVPVFDPVVNMTVLCYNTPYIGRLHSITSTLALLSPILSCASFIVVHVDWVDADTNQVSVLTVNDGSVS